MHGRPEGQRGGGGGGRGDEKAGLEVPHAALIGEREGATDGQGAFSGVLVVAPTARELGGLTAKGGWAAATVGIGHEAAPALAALLRERRPALVLSLGFAGALQPGLRTGMLTLHTTTLAAHGTLPPFPYDGGFASAARAGLSSEGITFQEGPLLTVERVLLTPAAKHAHGAASGALAADMEGYWLARTAAEAGVPMVAVRAVLDEADHRLPLTVDAIISDGGRHEWLHALGSLRRPWEAVSLFPLAVRSRHAGQSLRRAARVLLPALLDAAGRPQP